MLPTDLVASNGVESVENDVRAHVLDWRRDRDSNPGTLTRQRFSRPPQSTTLPPLRSDGTLMCIPRLLELQAACVSPGVAGH